MCIITVLLTSTAREQRLKQLRIIIVVDLFSASCRSQLETRRQPYSKTRRLVAFWLSASRVHKMLGAKLGFRVLITSADLLPSTAGFGPSAMFRGPPPDTTR